MQFDLSGGDLQLIQNRSNIMINIIFKIFHSERGEKFHMGKLYSHTRLFLLQELFICQPHTWNLHGSRIALPRSPICHATDLQHASVQICMAVRSLISIQQKHSLFVNPPFSFNPTTNPYILSLVQTNTIFTRFPENSVMDRFS